MTKSVKWVRPILGSTLCVVVLKLALPHSRNFIYCDIEISLTYLLYSSQIGPICEKSCETMAGRHIVAEITKKSIACL